MKTRKQVLETVRRLNPELIGNDGPTSVLCREGGKQEALCVSGDAGSITVTAGRFPFRRRFRFRRDEL